LLGSQRIGLLNLILVGQSVLQLACFVIFLRMSGASTMDYISALYIANGTAAVISGTVVLRALVRRPSFKQKSVLHALFDQGGMAQGADLLQLLNYRLAYYLIEHFRGLGALGVFSVTTQLAESTWLIPKSIGGVLYSKISNLSEAERQRDLSVILMKVSIGVALLASIVLIAMPERVYSAVFGEEIIGVKPILLIMMPGLLAMAGSQVLSHYLSGTGRVKHNTVGSAIGLLVTVPLGMLLIPRFGLEGAAFTASSAYCASVLYQLRVFLRVSGSEPKDLLPHRGDGDRAMSVWKRWRAR
jgi:O-antigen/teichoic acid export membrane protein